MDAWRVTKNGRSHQLRVTGDGLVLEGPDPAVLTWSEVRIDFPTSYSAQFDGLSPQSVGFASTADQRSFREALAAVGSDRTGMAAEPQPLSSIALLTTPDYPGHDHLEVVTMVTASVVMSRNAISDFGSDVKSVFGGSLGGVEIALGKAVAEAQDRLRRSAREAGADAVVAVSVTISGVADKAEAVVMAGTAVRLEPRPATAI